MREDSSVWMEVRTCLRELNSEEFSSQENKRARVCMSRGSKSSGLKLDVMIFGESSTSGN
jgi:hypothetical protein